MNRVGFNVFTVGRVLALCAVFWLITVAPVRAAPQGEWVTTGPPIFGLNGSLVVLTNGTPLLFDLDLDPQSQAEHVQQYDSETGAWTRRGGLQTNRSGASLTVLPSINAVLLAGGANRAGNLLATAEIYNPTTGTSMLTGSMHFARTDHQATLLASGKVLVSGGRVANNQLVAPAEIYDPATGTWSFTGAVNHPRVTHAAVRLLNGKVLVAGGSGASGSLASVEVYDPVTELWTFASPMAGAPSTAAGLLLGDGRVLVVGAGDGGSDVVSQLYDAGANTWTPRLVVLTYNAGFAGPVLLHDGSALIVLGGCFQAPCQFHTSALFDIQAQQWSALLPLRVTVVRSSSGPIMGVLPDGRALIATSGVNTFGGIYAPSAQVFRPDNTTPRLVVSPPSMVFQTGPGIPVRQTMNIQNTGGSTLTGSVTASAPFAIVSGSPFALTPGASASVVVQFTAAGFGTFIGNIQVMSNGNWAAVPVTGGAGVQISGRVTDIGGVGVGGITINLTGAAFGSMTTDVAGNYHLFVPPNNGYNLTPAGPRLAFSPIARSVILGTQDIAGVNFTASTASEHIGVFRNGSWFPNFNDNGQWDGCGVGTCHTFGLPTDKPIAGDWTGTGKAKIGVFRNGGWSLDLNGNGQWDGCNVDGCLSFGLHGDEPVVGDWTGAGPAKIGVVRDGYWFLDLNGNGQWDGCAVDACLGFGLPGDLPIAGDWTGTGHAKIGVFRNGYWFLDLNGNGQWDGCAVDACLVFGLAGDHPVVGDWGGTGQAKIGVFRNGAWFLDVNGNGQWDGCSVDACIGFGLPGDSGVVGHW